MAGTIHALKQYNAREQALESCTLIKPYRRQRERPPVPTLPVGTATFSTRAMSSSSDGRSFTGGLSFVGIRRELNAGMRVGLIDVPQDKAKLEDWKAQETGDEGNQGSDDLHDAVIQPISAGAMGR